MGGPVDRVFDALDQTLAADEQPDDIAIDPKDPTVEAKATGYSRGWREGRAELRKQIGHALAGDPSDDFYMSVPPDWQGIYITHGRSLMTRLDDSGSSIVPDTLTTIERRIMAARLRAWADAFDSSEATS
jgi:hypothetical protein